jgi:hypothetical protein
LGFLAFESFGTTCDPLREVEVIGHLTRLSRPEHGHEPAVVIM